MPVLTGTTTKQVVICRDTDGTEFVVGPVYSDKGADKLRELIAAAGATVLDVVHNYSQAEFVDQTKG